MPRKRSRGAHLPPNLYLAGDRQGYRYRGERWETWRLPEHEAVAEAIRRNALRTGNPNSVHRVIERYIPYLRAAGHADSTLAAKITTLRWYQRAIGRFDIRGVTRKALAAKWKTMSPHTWGKHRQVWIDLYRFAIAEGICEVNEAAMTLAPQAPDLERARVRHTVEGYEAIYAAAEEWLQIAMEVALASLQDRSTLVRARRADVAGGRWILTRSKTDAHLAVRIPPGSRLDRALQRALAFPVAGNYLIRRQPQRRDKRLREFTQVTGSMLQHAFAEARDRAGAYDHLPPKERPAFRDLRALGAWLYGEAGYPGEYVQQLMAHKSLATTKQYQDGHKVEYAEVEAGLHG